RETFIAAAVAAVIAVAISPTDPALGELPFHPAWIVALVLVARYGAGGLYAVPGVVLGLQTAMWISGSTNASALARLTQPSELLVLLAIALIAAVGALHQRRAASLQERLDDA